MTAWSERYRELEAKATKAHTTYIEKVKSLKFCFSAVTTHSELADLFSDWESAIEEQNAFLRNTAAEVAAVQSALLFLLGQIDFYHPKHEVERFACGLCNWRSEMKKRKDALDRRVKELEK